VSATEPPPALFAGVEPLEVFVELLADLPTERSSTDFYDRICEAICRLTTMRRAAIFMADLPRRRAVVVGAHGTSFRELITLSPSPVLQSEAVLHDSRGYDLDVSLREGRIILTNTKEKGPAKVWLRLPGFAASGQVYRGECVEGPAHTRIAASGR